MPDKGWLQSHPRDLNQRGSANDGDGGRTSPKMLGMQKTGHIAKFCPQKNENAAATTTADSAAATTTISKQAEAQGPSQVQPKKKTPGGLDRGYPEEDGVLQTRLKKSRFTPFLRNKPRPHHHHQQHQNHQKHRNHFHRHPIPHQSHQQHQQLQ